MTHLLDWDDPLRVPRPTEPGWALIVMYDHETRSHGVMPVRLRELDSSIVKAAADALDDALLARAAKQAGIDEWWKLTYKQAAEVRAKFNPTAQP